MATEALSVEVPKGQACLMNYAAEPAFEGPASPEAMPAKYMGGKACRSA